MDELKSRVEREKKSYDIGTVHEESTKLHVRFRHVFQCPNVQKMDLHFEDAIARLAPGAKLLDYGCYDGWMVPKYHAYGTASITGIDISEKGIAIARDKHGQFAQFEVCDAHAMPFQDKSFDLVVGRAILHHLNFELALSEIHRVLKPGGAALFIEPLGDNPAAKLARMLTPKARTPDEAALSAHQIRYADKLFGGRSNHFFSSLLSVPVALGTSLFMSRSDNVFLRATDQVDSMLSRSPLKYWMRVVALCWTKSRS